MHSVALVLSLIISLTLTPMMCARLLKPEGTQHGLLYRLLERLFDGLLNLYEAGLKDQAAAAVIAARNSFDWKDGRAIYSGAGSSSL